MVGQRAREEGSVPSTPSHGPRATWQEAWEEGERRPKGRVQAAPYQHYQAVRGKKAELSVLTVCLPRQTFCGGKKTRYKTMCILRYH